MTFLTFWLMLLPLFAFVLAVIGLVIRVTFRLGCLVWRFFNVRRRKVHSRAGL